MGAWLKRKVGGAGKETDESKVPEVAFVLAGVATTALLVLLAIHAW